MKRIARQEGNTNASLHIGTGEALHGAAYLIVARKRDRQRLALLAQLPVAFATGAVAPIWGHWVRVHLALGLQGMQNLICDMLLSVGVMLCLWLVLGLHGRASWIAQITGATLGIVVFPKLVAALPALFATLFSPSWVDTMIASGLPL